MIAQLVSSSYAYTWDIKMDWGFMDKNSGENPFLREEIVFPSKGYYYFAIIEDFVLRFAWSIAVALKYNRSIRLVYIIIVLKKVILYVICNQI